MAFFIDKKWRKVPGIAWAFFILVGCLMPQDQLPEPHFDSEDLVVHLFFYAVLSVFFVLAYIEEIEDWSSQKIIYIFLSMLAFSILIEILQKILPIHRFFSLSDILFNGMGAAVIFGRKEISIFIKKLIERQ